MTKRRMPFDPTKCTITTGSGVPSRAGAGAISLVAWLETRKGHEIQASWKSEDGDYGPVCITDLTESKADTRAVPGFGVPYGATYSGRTNWIASKDALALIKHFGFTRSKFCEA